MTLCNTSRFLPLQEIGKFQHNHSVCRIAWAFKVITQGRLSVGAVCLGCCHSNVAMHGALRRLHIERKSFFHRLLCPNNEALSRTGGCGPSAGLSRAAPILFAILFVASHS